MRYEYLDIHGNMLALDIGQWLVIVLYLIMGTDI